MLLVSEPNLGDDEKAALAEVIESNWITMGERVRAFELAFAEAHGAMDAVAVNSCTAGLHLALEALGIGPGDEVLVPSLSFVATANCVLYCGATPVFVDIESLDEPVLARSEAADKCNSRTRAVVVMHYAGAVVDGPAWRDFADRRGLALIEDSAHAVGAERGEIFGDAAVFSFYGNKNMTTGEGGMVIAPDPDVMDRVRHARGHGLTSSTIQRLAQRAAMYDVTMLGYNYRMTELSAAIGLVQLRKLPAWNSKRGSLTAAYRAVMERLCPEVIIPFSGQRNSSQRKSSHHILPAILPCGANPMAAMAALRDDGIQTSMHYPPIHSLAFYKERFPGVRLPLTEDFAARELTLPLHPKMEPSDVECVVGSLARHLGDDERNDGANGR